MRGEKRCMILPKGGKLDKEGGGWYTREGSNRNKSYKEPAKVAEF